MQVFNETNVPQAFNKAIWHEASRRLLAKVIEEFAYERVFEVISEQPGSYAIEVGPFRYRFRAKRYVFDNLVVEPDSVVRTANGVDGPIHDAMAFVAEVLPHLGVKPMTTAHFLRELGNTLTADAHSLATATKTGAELALLDDVRMDGELTGHPWVTVSKGRIGLGYRDYAHYTPENRTPFRVAWLAVSRVRARFVGEEGLSNEGLVREAVGEERFAAFLATLHNRGGSLESHLLMPVHPWQWDQAIIPNFAGDIAEGHIVYLGEGEDLYLAQQSVRTVSNVSDPAKSTLKLCMNILNTAVYRGIPGKRALTAAPLTTFLDQLVQRDAFLSATCRLALLGERAGMHYVHPLYSTVPGAPYQFNEMLGCLWRDSLSDHLAAGETGMPLAAFAHAGSDGQPVAVALAKTAGVPLSVWMERFFDVVLVPVYHLLVKHGLYFSAHGQNATVILKNGMPERLALRDFIDDVMVCDRAFPESAGIPEGPAEVLLHLPPEVLIHGIQTTLFVCVFRYMSVLLDQRAGFGEAAFWAAANNSVLRYQRAFPDLAERFAIFDLFVDEYPRLCLNRVRLFTHGYADDDERPVPDFQGMVANPLTALNLRDHAA